MDRAVDARGAGRRLLTFAAMVVLGWNVAPCPAAEPAQAARLPYRLVLTQLPVGSDAEKAGPQAGGMLRADYGLGARLILREPDGALKILSTGFHSAADADVSFDGKRVLFAGKRTAADPWNVYEISLETLQYRQITKNLGDCRYPAYHATFFVITEKTPWEQIGFISTRAGLRNEAAGAPASALFTCKLDGSLVQQISYNLSSDYDTAVMDDGRMLYATWRRATLDDGLLGRIAIEGINTDGSDRAVFVPGAARRIRHMPCSTATGLVVFVEGDSMPWDGSGQLGSVAVRRPLTTYRPLTKSHDWLFHTPHGLPDGRLLVSARRADGSGSLGLYCMDLATLAFHRLLDDSRYHEMQARPIVARREPDGRASAVSPEDPTAKFYCLNAYTTEFKDRSWLAAGSIDRVRILEGIAAKAGEGPSASPLAGRRILGETPLAKDGSLHLIVPANTPIQIQLLDRDGMALRSCGWIWARSHQAQGCIGCHEDPELTPTNYFTDSLGKAAASVAVPPEDRHAVEFRRDVYPMVEKKCLPCHGAGGDAPQLAQAGDSGHALVRKVYDALLIGDPQSPAGGYGKYVHAGRARTSPLVWHLLGRNAAKPWDGKAAQGQVKPIPAGKGVPLLTDAERATLVRWIDTGAAWDVKPSPARTGAEPLVPVAPANE